MEALELRNRQLTGYIEGLERDLAGRIAEQVIKSNTLAWVES